MAITTFKAERRSRGRRIPRYNHIWLDGHEIGRYVRGFEIVEGIGEPPTVKLEVVAYATIIETEPEDEDA